MPLRWSHMGLKVSEIKGNPTVCSTACPGKQQSSTALARYERSSPVTNGFPTKGQSCGNRLHVKHHHVLAPHSARLSTVLKRALVMGVFQNYFGLLMISNIFSLIMNTEEIWQDKILFNIITKSCRSGPNWSHKGVVIRKACQIFVSKFQDSVLTLDRVLMKPLYQENQIEGLDACLRRERSRFAFLAMPTWIGNLYFSFHLTNTSRSVKVKKFLHFKR